MQNNDMQPTLVPRAADGRRYFSGSSKLLNRSALILRYKEAAVRWINEADPNPDGPEITLGNVNEDRSVYLIDEEVADTPEQLRKWVKANFRPLFESELGGWYVDSDLWPRKLTLKLFDEWFTVECHTVILDTVGGPIEDDEV